MYDEACVTLEESELPPMAIALQQAGYNNTCSTPSDTPLPIDDSILKVQLLTDDAKLPDKSTPYSAGLDINSAIDKTILPGEHIISTDIAIEPSPQTYAQICNRSSFAAKGITVLRGG